MRFGTKPNGKTDQVKNKSVELQHIPNIQNRMDYIKNLVAGLTLTNLLLKEYDIEVINTKLYILKEMHVFLINSFNGLYLPIYNIKKCILQKFTSK